MNHVTALASIKAAVLRAARKVDSGLHEDLVYWSGEPAPGYVEAWECELSAITSSQESFRDLVEVDGDTITEAQSSLVRLGVQCKFWSQNGTVSPIALDAAERTRQWLFSRPSRRLLGDEGLALLGGTGVQRVNHRTTDGATTQYCIFDLQWRYEYHDEAAALDTNERVKSVTIEGTTETGDGADPIETTATAEE